MAGYRRKASFARTLLAIVLALCMTCELVPTTARAQVEEPAMSQVADEPAADGDAFAEDNPTATPESSLDALTTQDAQTVSETTEPSTANVEDEQDDAAESLQNTQPAANPEPVANPEPTDDLASANASDATTLTDPDQPIDPTAKPTEAPDPDEHVELNDQNGYEAYFPIAAPSTDTPEGALTTQSSNVWRLHVWVSLVGYGSEPSTTIRIGDQTYVNYRIEDEYGNAKDPKAYGKYVTAQFYAYDPTDYNYYTSSSIQSYQCWMRTRTDSNNLPGEYRCKVVLSGFLSASCGVSWHVFDTVPNVYSHPFSVTVREGEAATFSVGATGTHLCYQWCCVPAGSTTGRFISGATSSTYRVTASSANANSSYYCLICNYGNQTGTYRAVLHVTYPVTYDANGGRGGPTCEYATYGQRAYASASRPSREGLEFVGWSANKGGGGTLYAPGQALGTSGPVTLYAQWKSTKTSIATATVALSSSSYTYDGAQKNPSLTVRIGSKTLTQGTDYTVEAPVGRIGVGTYTYTVKGTGSYTGTKTVNLRITAKPVTACSISVAAAHYTYDGRAKTPAVTVRDGRTTLAAGTHYKLTYAANVNAGTASVTVTGMGNYGGTATKTFSIACASLDKAKVASIKNQGYTGGSLQPSPVVTLSGRRLEAGRDYKLSYKHNIKRGKATVIITGTGNYKGTKKAAFKIVRQSIAGASVARIANKTYTGRAIKPSPVVKVAGRTLRKNVDYKLSYKNNKRCGTATVIIRGKGNYKGTKRLTFRIAKPGISSVGVFGVASQTYTGDAIRPNPVVKLNGRKLRLNKDYKLAYKNNVNAGTATVIVRGMGGLSGTKSVHFTIAPRNVAGASIASVADQRYTGAQVRPTPDVKVAGRMLMRDRDYTLSYANNVAAGTATIVVTGRGNYTGSATRTFYIVRGQY